MTNTGSLQVSGATGGAVSNGNWVRPSGWLPMPNTAAIPHIAGLLTAIFPAGNNRVRITATTGSGTYTINWGDGTQTSGITSGVAAEKTYTFSSVSAATEVTVAGLLYRQCLITVTPDTGTLLTVVPFQNHSLDTGSRPLPYLEAMAKSPTLTGFKLGAFSGNLRSSLLQHYELRDCVASMAWDDTVWSCSSLEKITFPDDTSKLQSTLGGGALNNARLKELVNLPATLSNSSLGNLMLSSAIYAYPSVSLPNNTSASIFSGASFLNVIPALTVGASCPALNLTDYRNLRTCIINGLKNSLNLTNANLDADAANACMTALGTANASQILTLTGNPCVGQGGLDTSIATAKGWTVTL
jgi:hypothetical protein